ncbi:MAG: glycosyltransferase [Cyanobacteria bacterium J06632_3]
MTVALIAYYLGPRLGIGQYLDRLLPPLITAMDKRGIKPLILSSPNALEKTPALQKLSAYVKVVPELDMSPGKRYVWLMTKFRGVCDRNNIQQVVWLSNPVLLPWHPPSIAVIHDVNEWKAKEKYGSRLKTALRSLIYLDASIQRSQSVIAVSQATADDILHFRPQPALKRKLQVISNGADSALASLAPVDIDVTDDQPFLLSVGRIDPAAKRLPEAVQLVQALREHSGQNWELHMVGGMNASTQAEGEAFLDSVKELPWVHYQGHVNDAELAQWYRQASAVVYLSASEGFGLPIAEAASFKQWVVVNEANQAALEAGKGSIIPIVPSTDVKVSTAAAKRVLEQLSANEVPCPSESLPTWQDAAEKYTDAIAQLI